MNSDGVRRAIVAVVVGLFHPCACGLEPIPADAIDGSVPPFGGYWGDAAAICGDETIGVTEQCDDGNADAGDGCSDLCKVEGGWTCSGTGPSVCYRCGNGIVEGDERCDDSNADDDDGCSATCVTAIGWTCVGTPSVCAECGDGDVEGGEECDDGGREAGDGCSPECSIECPEGWYDASGNLCWEHPPTQVQWEGAVSHCENLTKGGHTWRLPVLEELRSLVRGCPGTELGGACAIGHGSDDDDWSQVCDGCPELAGPGAGGCYMNAALGDTCDDLYWSSSVHGGSSGFVWVVDYDNGSIAPANKTFTDHVRCVRDGP